MVGNTDFMKKNIFNRSAKVMVVFVMLMLMVLLVQGFKKNEENDGVRVAFKRATQLITKWEDAFEQHEVISFFKDSPDKELYTIGWVAINSKGDYFISDGKIRQIFQFDAEGRLIRKIGRQGRGPGEYNLPRFPLLDEQDNLYFFDSSSRSVLKYSFPDYQYETSFNLGRSAQDLYRDPEGNFLVYSLYSLEYKDVLFKLDPAGNILHTAHAPEFKNFRIFISRFQIGSFGFPTQSDDILFLYPYNYEVSLYDRQLNLKKIFFSNQSSTFTPSGEPFPHSWNPYHYSPKISKWWGKQLRPMALFGFGNGMFLVELGKYDNLETESYANIHDVNGVIYAEGLKVPHSVMRYSKDGYIYIVEDSSFDENGNITPLRLHRYKLKNLKRIGE